MSTLDTALISIAGIFVSGIVGPQLTALATFRANRKQFNRDRISHQRDDLRVLLDEAAVLLASGATNLRHLREANLEGRQASPDIKDWLCQVFPLGQRLHLRLPADHEVVKAYDAARESLTTATDANIDTVVCNFETKRSYFLDVARDALSKPISEKG